MRTIKLTVAEALLRAFVREGEKTASSIRSRHHAGAVLLPVVTPSCQPQDLGLDFVSVMFQNFMAK